MGWHSEKYQIQMHIILEETQRKMMLRVCADYRTVSAEASQIIVSIVPIDLLIKEWIILHGNPEN